MRPILGAALGLDEPAAYGIERQRDAIAQVELLEHVVPVALDRVDADREDVGDLAAGVALGDQLYHLALARAQLLSRCELAALHAPEIVAHERADRLRVQERLAAHRG